jgi:hypothetical protein
MGCSSGVRISSQGSVARKGEMGAPELTLCQVNRSAKSTFALKHGIQSTGLQLPLILAAEEPH